MFEEQKICYTVALVDENNPDVMPDDLIYDITSIDGKIIISKQDFNDTQVDEDKKCFVTPYVKYEVSTINDLKEAISKKRVVQDFDGEDAVIVSNLSDEDTFLSIFGNKDLQEISYAGLVYFVKGKTKKMKIGDFVEREML